MATAIRHKNVANACVDDAVAIVVAIVVAAVLRPKTVAEALQIHAFTSLSQLLLPRVATGILRRSVTNPGIYDVVAIVVGPDLRPKIRRGNVTYPRVYSAVAIVVATDVRPKTKLLTPGA